MPVKKLKRDVHAAAKFHTDHYRTKVLVELSGGREINALFLIHGYIESYLVDWLLIRRRLKTKKLVKDVSRELRRSGLKNILNLHLMIGTIGVAEYQKACALNELRNDVAHDLANIAYDDIETKEEIKSQVLESIELCKTVFDKYMIDVKRVGEEKIKEIN